MYTVWLTVDAYASMGSSPEEEYAELEAKLREWLPGRDLAFQRGRTPTDLSAGSPDVYLWDIGGLCVVDFSGERRLDWSHAVVRAVDSHPSTLFVPWTMMTRQVLRRALEDLLPELVEVRDGDKPFPALPVRPNVWCPGPEGDFRSNDEMDLAERLRQWLPCPQKPWTLPAGYPATFQEPTP